LLARSAYSDDARVTGRANFRGGRRRGVRGYLGFLRGVVEDAEGHTVRVRSLALASALVEALNAGSEVAQPHQTPDSRARRYSTLRTPNKRGDWIVVAAERGVDPGRFGDGMIAATDDRRLAERVAELLNVLDPRHFKRPPKGSGFGWW
jgi:hypothetical protein